MTILAAGTRAPAFTLHASPDQSVALKEFRGRNVVLAFYPADWSPVCSDQLALYNELLDEFARFNAQLLAISVDGVWSHAALARERRYCFPLLSDFGPKGKVARAYGVYDAQLGLAQRALFVIDGDGMIRWSHLSPIGVNPGAAGIVNALEALPSNNVQKALPVNLAREAS
ncbi:redoxin domain-containing protein [Rhodanobacter denitrificans]|uniref:redoxin domain-containing protein n=1 Tax=Rhodanobacter denitrificans TaxID=666685 RepID=UPI000260EEB8|nr:redoxin domain-containing protein [Rhodanobacter denitrificans]EIM03223.1 thioredoxin peroxidase [Rhodanobacter denitrificans]UJM90418.1 redoxin domain-containing protein [Rhodanobacter denitrificans]